MVGLTLIAMTFWLCYRYRNLEGLRVYETDRRKTQEKSEILARQLPSGKRTGALVHGYVCSVDPGLYVVGERDLLVPDSR